MNDVAMQREIQLANEELENMLGELVNTPVIHELGEQLQQQAKALEQQLNEIGKPLQLMARRTDLEKLAAKLSENLAEAQQDASALYQQQLADWGKQLGQQIAANVANLQTDIHRLQAELGQFLPGLEQRCQALLSASEQRLLDGHQQLGQQLAAANEQLSHQLAAANGQMTQTLAAVNEQLSRQLSAANAQVTQTLASVNEQLAATSQSLDQRCEQQLERTSQQLGAANQSLQADLAALAEGNTAMAGVVTLLHQQLNQQQQMLTSQQAEIQALRRTMPRLLWPIVAATLISLATLITAASQLPFVSRLIGGY